MWQPQTPIVIVNNPDFVSIQSIDVREAFYNYDNLTTGPAAAALAISTEIAAELTAGRLAPDTVCVLLKNFGDDHDPEAAKPLTAYTASDRLVKHRGPRTALILLARSRRAGTLR